MVSEGQGAPEAAAGSIRLFFTCEYLREYVRWLWPNRYALSVVLVLALVTAGLQMIDVCPRMVLRPMPAHGETVDAGWQ